MRKTWVKRDNIYYKPFYKQKFKMTLLGVVFMALIFFGYQFFYISQLPETSSNLGPTSSSERHHEPVLRNGSSQLNGLLVEKKDVYERKILR
jgi:hypothetical protein